MRKPHIHTAYATYTSPALLPALAADFLCYARCAPATSSTRPMQYSSPAPVVISICFQQKPVGPSLLMLSFQLSYLSYLCQGRRPLLHYQPAPCCIGSWHFSCLRPQPPGINPPISGQDPIAARLNSILCASPTHGCELVLTCLHPPSTTWTGPLMPRAATVSFCHFINGYKYRPMQAYL